MTDTIEATAIIAQFAHTSGVPRKSAAREPNPKATANTIMLDLSARFEHSNCQVIPLGSKPFPRRPPA